MTRPVAILLAAGGSSRMGTNKALLPLDGRALVRRHIEALGARCDVLVVVGHEADAVGAVCGGARTVHNADWYRTEQSDSLRLALQAVPDADAVLVTPVDVAPVPLSVLERLVGHPRAAVPCGPDGDGHPVWLCGRWLHAARTAPMPVGLRGVLEDADRVPVGRPVGADFDDAVAWQRFLARHRSDQTA